MILATILAGFVKTWSVWDIFGQIIEISEIPSQYGGNFVYSPGYITGFKPFYSADALKYTELEKPGVNELHVAEHGDADSEDTRGCDGLKGD